MARQFILVICFLLLAACAQLPKNYSAEISHAFTDTERTTLGKKFKTALKTSNGKPVVRLLNEGTDAFWARIMIMVMAERSIDVQYYIWKADLVGKLMFNEVLIAADRGVRVRMLLDDYSIDRKIEDILYALDQHNNIEVRLFNPFASRGFRLLDYLTDASRINRRMHNKSLTVDNQITIVGGRNIGDEYFSADKEGNFRDLDALSIGYVVQEVEEQFDAYWNSESAYPVKAFDNNKENITGLENLRKELAEFSQSQQESDYAEDLKDSVMYKEFNGRSFSSNPEKYYSGDVKVLYDDPGKNTGKSDQEVVYLKSYLKPNIEEVSHTFELISPYFVPGSKGIRFLTEMVKQGIKVRVVTNSLSSTDGVLAQSGYSRSRIRLLEGGVELYELRADTKTKASKSLRRGDKAKSGLHAKVYVFDRKKVFIGSFNFDPRSININTEVGVLYKIPDMAEFIATNVFDEGVKEKTYKLVLEVEESDDTDIDSDFDTEQYNVVWIGYKDGKEVRYYTDPETSVWRRFIENIYSILPIESQL